MLIIIEDLLPLLLLSTLRMIITCIYAWIPEIVVFLLIERPRGLAIRLRWFHTWIALMSVIVVADQTTDLDHIHYAAVVVIFNLNLLMPCRRWFLHLIWGLLRCQALMEWARVDAWDGSVIEVGRCGWHVFVVLIMVVVDIAVFGGTVGWWLVATTALRTLNLRAWLAMLASVRVRWQIYKWHLVRWFYLTLRENATIFRI